MGSLTSALANSELPYPFVVPVISDIQNLACFLETPDLERSLIPNLLIRVYKTGVFWTPLSQQECLNQQATQLPSLLCNGTASGSRLNICSFSRYSCHPGNKGNLSTILWATSETNSEEWGKHMYHVTKFSYKLQQCSFGETTLLTYFVPRRTIGLSIFFGNFTIFHKINLDTDPFILIVEDG